MPHSTTLTEADKAACREVARLLSIEKHRSGMTHKELGRRINMSDKSVSAMVNERMRISLKTARKLTKVFHVPLQQILPWTAELADEASEIMDVVELYQQLDDKQRELADNMLRLLLHGQLSEDK